MADGYDPYGDPFRRETSVRSAMNFLNDCIDAADAKNPDVWIEALYRLAQAMHRDVTRKRFNEITNLYDQDRMDGRGME